MLLVDQAYEDIKNMICNFELIPGQIVSDFTLSKKMGMSRTPIRQALQKLEGDDLIVDAGRAIRSVLLQKMELLIFLMQEKELRLQLYVLLLKKGLMKQG